jgi:DNA polymerase III epsilon subunit-like protein
MKLENFNFSNIALFAQHLGKHVAIYDLETTTFRGRPNFGITEMSCFLVSPQGESAWVGGLLNPERAIDPRVVTLTGITQDMVRHKPTWGEKYARMFSNMATGECWVAGFNNATFDNPAVQDMNARYGEPIEQFRHTFDIRNVHLALSRSKTRTGKLVEIAQSYGVLPKGDLHRAQADVVLTVELLDAIIAQYGLEATVAQVEAQPPGAKPLLPAAPRVAAYAEGTLRAPSPARPGAPAPARASTTSQAIQMFVRDKDKVSLQMLAQALGVDELALSFEVGKAIDNRAVSPSVFAVDPAQAWICQELMEMDTEVLTQGKLKPIYDALAPTAPEGHLDYIQLRVALLTAGQTWSTLRTL